MRLVLTVRRSAEANTHTLLLPDKDADGKELWPLGDEKTWKESMRGADTGELYFTPQARAYIVSIFIEPNHRCTLHNEIHCQPCSDLPRPSSIQPRQPGCLPGCRFVRSR